MERRLDVDLREVLRRDDGPRRVRLTLRHFDVETALDLLEHLRVLGMTQVFCPALDFEGIIGERGLCIDHAPDQAAITVDEKGH